MLVKLSRLVKTPAVLILKTEPNPPVPPVLVVPYSSPSEAWTSAASGEEPGIVPVVPVKLPRLVKVPLVVTLNTVPKLPTPPEAVTP